MQVELNAESRTLGSVANPADLLDAFRRIRQETLDICAPLTLEDLNTQAHDHTSPPKWHVAHTTWFFDRLVLGRQDDDYPGYHYLFNSYYQTLGPFHQRPQRHLLTRPTYPEILAWRQQVDQKIVEILSKTDDLDPIFQRLLVLGLHHEQQHQELLWMDIKSNFFANPLLPVYGDSSQPRSTKAALIDQIGSDAPAEPSQWDQVPEGFYEVGADGSTAFAFDNERPSHKIWIAGLKMQSRPVSAGDWLAFIADGGYQRVDLWLSDGWHFLQTQQIRGPLYWFKPSAHPIPLAHLSHHRHYESCKDGWWQYDLDGIAPVDPDRPMTHLSFYEATAFAKWSGHRLPSEFEWEAWAQVHQAKPSAVWQWTKSSYEPYPGFLEEQGTVGEYNGKFMCNQYVLRGGCRHTPSGHWRVSYRNFYPPESRWAFTGLRLVKGNPQ